MNYLRNANEEINSKSPKALVEVSPEVKEPHNTINHDKLPATVPGPAIEDITKQAKYQNNQAFFQKMHTPIDAIRQRFLTEVSDTAEPALTLQKIP